MEKTDLEYCERLLRGVLVLTKEIETLDKRRLKMIERDVGIVKEKLGRARDELNEVG